MTTTPTSRAAPFVIAAAVLAGGYMMLVDPAKRQLAQARADAAQRDAEAARLRTVQAALPELAAAAEQARLDVQRIDRACTPAKDTGVLFATLANIASQHRVRVDQLDPFTPRTPAASPAPAAPADAPAPPPDIQLGYTMTVVATYGDLAGFLAALQAELGYTRILAVRLAPSPEGPEAVTARIQTVHHAFSLPQLAAEDRR